MAPTWEQTTSWCGKPLSILEFAKGHILTNPRFKKCGVLMQAFACDMFSISEQASVGYIRTKEFQRRLASHHDLEEAAGGEEPGRIILPGESARPAKSSPVAGTLPQGRKGP